MRQDRGSRAFSIGGILRRVGQPIYLILVWSVIILSALLGLISRLLVQIIKLPRPPRPRFFTKPKLPKIRFHLPKPSLPRIPLLRLPSFRLPSFHIPKPSLTLPKVSPFLLIPLGIVLTAGGIFYQLILKDLPLPQDLLTRHQPLTTKIYDRHGALLYKIYKDQNRTLIKLNSIPPHVISATLAIEDSEFYSHSGFSIRGMTRAIKRNLAGDSLEGGSTITQQLVKNALLTRERTITRKVKELILAVAVEMTFSKEQILEMYFNEVGYGGTAYGIEEAAQTYFGKNIKDVNLAEAALLAGLPQAPTVYSPFGAKQELAVLRQHEVLRRMVEEGMITLEEAEAAKAYELVYSPPSTDIKAPHFVMFVKDLLVQKYGEQVVSQGGLEVYTTLDLSVQKLAEEAVAKELDKVVRLNINNGAALVTNPKTGEILAMVGSKNYFDTKNDGQVNVTLRPRQPGSSIKPLNYALALENGFTPSSVIEDSPIIYRIPGSQPYAPQNYDGKFHGKVTLRQALANSYNVPAVKILSHLGVNNLISKAQSMGITTWDDPSRFGLSLTLGGGEVRMVDMAVAYGVFANMGYRVDLHPILKITDPTKNQNEQLSCMSDLIFPEDNPVVQAQNKPELPCSTEKVLNPQVAFQITDILSDNLARAAAFGTRSVLYLPPHQVAVKTGTTNNLRDNWTIGYTGDYVVAAWVGNNNNAPMSYVASGITGASPIWNTIMASLLKDNPPHQFAKPADIIAVTICATTNTLTCAGCPSVKTEYFIKGTQPTKACTKEMFDPPTPAPTDRDKILDGATSPTQSPNNRPQR